MAAPDITASFAVPVTPSDSADLPNGKCWGLWVGVAGDVTIDSAGQQVTFKAIQGLLPCNTTRVRATLTTATSIVAMYG